MYAAQYGVELPSLTLHRKVVGTKACVLPQEKQEKVAALMAHSLPTQKRYYRMLENRDNAAEAYEIIQKDLLSVPDVRKQRYTFSKKTTDMIEQYFENNITTRTLPRLAECARFLHDNPIESRSAKNIQDKVKTLIRQRK